MTKRRIKPEKQVVVPPRNLKGCPCRPLIATAMVKALNEGNNDISGFEVNVEVCKKLECKFLRERAGAYRCAMFMAELRNTKRQGMKQVGGTRLHMHAGSKSGWRYRDL